MVDEAGPSLPRFRMLNERFVCRACGRDVPPLRGGCRNHCPFCLVSVHVDDNPGDRAAGCGGLMDAVRAEPHARKGIVLTHRCRRCGAEKRNRAATADAAQPDNEDLLFELMAGPR